MSENYILVQKGFHILLPRLVRYIAQEMRQEYRENWWSEVLRVLDDNACCLPVSGKYDNLVNSLDTANALRLFDRKWNELFRKKLSIDYHNWSRELMGVRNNLAHLGGEDFSDEYTWRALDTISRLCEAFDQEDSEKIRTMLREARYGSGYGSTKTTETAPSVNHGKKSEGIMTSAAHGLPSWRDIIKPHKDVAQGRYKNAEFAADLAQVARGEGSLEYRDPVDFFARTYVTEGMTRLLTEALKRVTGKDGEPVIQLKTAFGGGKTHSLLALYHMMRGKVPAEKIPNVRPAMELAGVSTLPRANIAVLSGTSLNPAKPKRPNNFPSITINTLWGEMAAQLAESAGNPALYDFVKEADKKGVSPGSVALKNLFDAAAPCIILMDELVAYAKKIYGIDGLPAGSFDNFISFIQEITEAARASKNSLVVASIPESDIEIGGEAGQKALETIEHTFGRMESVWKPVAANEGFEVVRRRLFLDCENEEGKKLICKKFSELYNNNPGDFPMECRETQYLNRMNSCFPIHPEIFDRLYEDWATLDRFQRTRGVLRLMAAVIHELWMNNDASAMIMPGSIPLDIPNVRDELTRYLSENWNAIVDREVDGKKSIPYQKDKSTPRYGKSMAARRVARTIMLGSAPTDRAQKVRGIEASRIRLGIVQPNESIAIFNDALNTLQGSLQYLYSNTSDTRFWYDTRPTLRKTVEDRASQLPEAEVVSEIKNRLASMRKEPPFAGLHICPNSSLDVPDEQVARLVILCPEDTYKNRDPKSRGINTVKDIFDNRGDSPRIFRNMLAFVAPDGDAISSLKQSVRQYLAWLSVKKDKQNLNLDATQSLETESNLKKTSEAVDSGINGAYCWLLVPYIDCASDIKTVLWEHVRMSGVTDSIVSKAGNYMIQNDWLITKLSPALLLMELDRKLWKNSDSIEIKQLWSHLCTYCYLPRLASFEVLRDTVISGVNSKEYFAIAGGKNDERFIDLKFNQLIESVERSDCLVKINSALMQIVEEIPLPTERGETASAAQAHTQDESYPVITHPDYSADISRGQTKNTHFQMRANLDITRINRDVQKLLDEVISNLTEEDNVKVSAVLEVKADAPNGLSASTKRIVSENCNTLKVPFEFDD